MKTENRHDPYCLHCIYYGRTTKTCDYILIEDHSRPCPAGQGCTEKKTRRDNVAKASWDIELGRLLWLDGKSDAQIAEELGASKAAVTSVRLRKWQKGSERPTPKEATSAQEITLKSPAKKNLGETEEPPKTELKPEPRPVSMATPDGVYSILEEATKTKSGIDAICTADAILCLWNWDSADDLRRARAAINHLIRRLEG